MRLAILALALLTLPSVASAQLANGGADLRLFRPAVDSKGLFHTEGSEVFGHLDPSFGLILDGGFGLLGNRVFANDAEIAAMDARRSSRLVDRVISGTLFASLGLGDRVMLGLQLPLVVSGGPNATVPGLWNDGAGGVDGQGLGDLSLHGKVRLLRDPIGLALVVRAAIPTGAERATTGEPGFGASGLFVLEGRPHRRVRLLANAGYRLVTGTGARLVTGARTEPMAGNATDPIVTSAGDTLVHDDQLLFAAGLAVRATDSLDLIGEVYGSAYARSLGDPGALSMEALVGMKIFVHQSSYLQIGGGLGITPGMMASDWRATVGFVFEPSIGDRDGDGYKDDVDGCPDEPEDFDNFGDPDGCPDPDNDRDGILDDDDGCPLVPEDRDGDADEDGCPEGNERDRDGDGILDPADECPDDPEDRDGFRDEDGCPDLDNDQDGILDADDLCPDDPEDVDDFQDMDGCPDLDNDGDRILDTDDACPDEPETYNGEADEDGCPDTGIVEWGDTGLTIFRKIQFETDSARIEQDSLEVVDAIAAALNGNPDVRLVEVQGHADERGSDAYNLALTRDRAAAVLEALVQRGVARSRMRSEGYGEYCPIDPRSNHAAWEVNRRVEVKLIATANGPTGVEVSCPRARREMR